jgi:hypothetical protein
MPICCGERMRFSSKSCAAMIYTALLSSGLLQTTALVPRAASALTTISLAT